MTRSIRFRVTAVAALIVLVVLALTGVALVVLQRSALTDAIDLALAQRASDIEAFMTEREGVTELPSSLQEGFAQVVGPDSNVIAATPNLAGSAPLALEWSPGMDTHSTVTGLAVDDDVFRVLSRSLDDGQVLHVGTTYDLVGESALTLIGSLSLLIPVVVLLLGLVTWWLVGRTLRPVEAIRSQVAEIGSKDLHRRVSEPGSGDEIDRLASTMNEMLQRLQDSVTRESRFVADASHELRSPLTRLRGEIELLLRLRGPDPELSSLHEDVLLMQSIVEDLLYLARSDAGESVLEAADVDLDDLVLEECRHPSPAPIDVSDVSAAMVKGNRTMLRRAVTNLVDNALRHASTAVTVSLVEDDGWALLRVSDDGPGVPAGEAESIFDRFRRLDDARGPENGGTGLGLAIAREIAEVHRGSLRVANPGEPGAIFEMRLPLG